LVGFKNALGFFTRDSKLKGSLFFFLGLLFILIGWKLFTLFGFCMQLFGIFHLFRSFLGTILLYGQSLPVVGGFLRAKGDAIQRVVKNLDSSSKTRAKFEV
jgi:hypothetical protein